MSSNLPWLVSELGKEAINASRPFSFKEHPEVIFVNTGDVLGGKFLHADSSVGKGLPGQAKKALRRNDILLTEIRPGNGRFAFVSFEPHKYVVSTKFMVIESLGRVLPRFLYHVLTNQAALDEFQRIAESRSGTFPQITFDSIAHFPIPVPPVNEQHRLVRFLDGIEDRLDLLLETNATLEAIAQALFKSWFVDFDPVRAKQEGRAPEAMDEATAALFPDGFEESELGLVPRGWRVGTLSDLSTLNPESWSAKNHPKMVAYVDLANTKDNVIAEISEFSFDEAPSRARRVLRNGDTIVGTVRPGNRSFAFVSNASGNLTGSTGFAVLRPTREESSEFVYLTATGDSSIEYLAHVADGGAYPAVRPEVVSSLQCVVSDALVLRAFHEIAEPAFMKISANHQEAQTLATLRDTLLPRLISGQLRLPEVERFTEEVV